VAGGQEGVQAPGCSRTNPRRLASSVHANILNPSNLPAGASTIPFRTGPRAFFARSPSGAGCILRKTPARHRPPLGRRRPSSARPRPLQVSLAVLYPRGGAPVSGDLILGRHINASALHCHLYAVFAAVITGSARHRGKLCVFAVVTDKPSALGHLDRGKVYPSSARKFLVH